MSKKITTFSILLLSLLISLSYQACQQYTNNCEQCHPITNLCVVCSATIYKPDNEGGCVPSQQCITGENYCDKCNNNGDLCLQCELGFSPDENGGCANTKNCLVSENGKCLQCKDDFFLIKGYDLNFCKYKFSDDLKNCAEVNSYTGKCNTCNEGFYKSYDDNKCTNTDSCKKASFGICTSCNTGFFLDKTDDLCKTANNEFNGCHLSLDGKICSECNEGFFLSEDGFCVKTPNCAKGNKNAICIECSEGYFLSKNGNICTTEEHCFSADYQFGICNVCEESYYIESETRKCFSNKEDEKFNFCSTVSSGNCVKCEYDYQFGKDNKCVISSYCLESKNGICQKCEDGYHLGLDNNCVNVEKCIYSNGWGSCLECVDNYYYDSYENQCFPALNQYKNCKMSYSNENYCQECKNDFYLSALNKLCYSNTENGPLYKCAYSTDDGTECSECINNYFVGVKDLKCSKIEDCAVSENENKCVECDDYLCLNVKTQTCVTNYEAPKNDEEKFYYNCNKTNEEGTECEVCNDYSELVNGICFNNVECAEKKDEECVKCKEVDYDSFYLCLNSFYGCVETYLSNCLRCDNMYNFNECTECMEGYELNNQAQCVAKAES